MQAALAEVEARASDVQRLEATARAALGTLTGRPRVHIPECPFQPVELELDPLDHYVRQAREGRPELRMLEAAVNAREAAVRVAEAGFFPDFGFAYRIGQTWAPGMTNQTNPFVIDPANYTTVQAGLVMRWSLDVWGNAYRLNRANAQLDDTRAQAEIWRSAASASRSRRPTAPCKRRRRTWRRGPEGGGRPAPGSSRRRRAARSARWSRAIWWTPSAHTSRPATATSAPSTT